MSVSTMAIHEREHFLFLIYCAETDELILQSSHDGRAEGGTTGALTVADRDWCLPSNQSPKDRSWKHVALQLIQEVIHDLLHFLQ